ncbi:hypothetical protein [uncultured Sulfitobacter sp.]|uniref:hypothetical protein n=1 Tax=uncultured Sulfitobacter sp. TaxID=191468 RepID=UPI00262C753E|nr:hypothetical protein [uncultured Sulfitobacter sp.]
MNQVDMDTRIDSFTSLLVNLPDITREGFLVHAMRMPSSAQTLLLPRQLAYYYTELPVRAPTPDSASGVACKPVGFVCGVSGRNLLPTVNYCQDLRAWRAQLQRQNIKVAEAASFSGRSQRDHIRYAQKIGYPVVLKPVIRNTLFEETFKDIGNDTELEHLFHQSRALKKQKASDLTASPYAMTRLSEDHVDKQGNKFLPLSIRYMVEKQRTGQAVRLILAGDKVVAAFIKSTEEGEPWQQADALHDSYLALGAKIAQVLQGMAFLRVDLIIDDPTEPSSKSKDNYALVSVSEHLKCYKLLAGHPEAAWEVLTQVAECQKPDLQSQISREVELSGVSDGPRLKRELTQTAIKLGVDIDLKELDQVTGRVQFTASGPLWAVAGLTWMYANGLGIEEVPTSVTCQ